MQTAATVATEPALDPLVAWSQGLRWDPLPEATRTMVRNELLDYLGAAIAGRAVAGIPPWLQVLIDMGGRPDAAVLGGPKLPAHTAALCNGYYGHVLEMDDTHDEAVLHAGAATIPAVLAATGLRAQQGKPVSGQDLCAAVLVGIEVTCRLGVATRLNLVEGGWIYTALLGHFGATLAVARLLGMKPEATRHALGIVYCLASGNHQSTREGASTKHVQPGFAAANAVLAALMAGAGLDGVRAPITGEDGLNRVYLRERFDVNRATAGLGQRFEIDRLSFKPYPTCRLTHPAISAALRLHAVLDGQTDSLDRIELVIGPQAHDVVGRATPERLKPATRVAAQFSVQWAVAVALAHGAVTPRQLLSEIPPSARVQALIARIDCRADAAAAQRDVGGCTLRAHGPSGVREVQETNAKGHPDNPLTAPELLAKFTANVALAGIDGKTAATLAQQILGLDAVADVSPLMTQLQALSPPSPETRHV